MPKNPYDFVRLADRVDRQPLIDHAHFEGERGRLTCELEVLTPLFIYHPGDVDRTKATAAGKRAHESARFPRRGTTAWIPGSSLKGVIRSVAEAVSFSCLTLFDADYERRQVFFKAPSDLQRCQRHNNRLCPACRLFGMLNRGEVYQGNVMIGDAEAPAGHYTLGQRLTLIPLSSPKPHHSAFYADPRKPEQLRGRKFYLHHPQAANLDYFNPPPPQTDQNKTVEPALPGSIFVFHVDYENVRLADLRLLLYALALNAAGGVRHKIGLGKPVGLGSVHIRIAQWERWPVGTARYHGGVRTTLDGPALQADLDSHLAAFRQHAPAGQLADLERIWLFNHPDTVRYPDQAWFRSHATTPLDKAW